MSKIIQKINEKLEPIKPFLEAHGGGISIEDFDEKTGILIVRLFGACHGCPLQSVTFKNIVESQLSNIEGISEIKLSDNE